MTMVEVATGDRLVGKIALDSIEPVAQRECGDCQAEPNRELQRCVGEPDQSVGGETQHFPERIFGDAGRSRRPMELTAVWRKPSQAKITAHETVLLGHCAEDVENPAMNQAEVADVLRDVDLRQAAQ